MERAEALRRATSADHGVLGTLHPQRGVDLVPVSFALLGDVVAIPIDTVKPKRSTDLGRARNLERDPRATLLVEGWDRSDWSRLWWVRLSMRRSEEERTVVADLEQSLRARYPQYRGASFAAVLTFRIEGLASWAASDQSATRS